MKSLIPCLFAVITLTAQAQTTVPIVWPFSLGSHSGHMVREIVNEANSQQNKFNFVLENRPGAGGAVATNHVLASKAPMVLVHSNSFFTRPVMFSEGSYDVNLFTPLAVFCDNQPLALIAKNVNNLRDLDSNRKYTVGINPGSITQLVSNEFVRRRANTVFTEVFFKTTPEATIAVLGDHVDFTIEFLATIQDDRLKPLAITGNQNVGPHRTFASQGIPGLEKLTVGYYLMINRAMDSALADELGSILSRASQATKVTDACRRDFGQPTNITGVRAQQLFRERRDFFAAQVQNLPKQQ